MEPTTPAGPARREQGRRKAALATAAAAVLGAAAVGAIGFGLSTASAAVSTTTSDDSPDRLQAPDSGLSSGSGHAHTGSGAS
ncbi:hypothetical protein [Amycolatopsis sp. cmx-4-61]|uniref:hypothetical protein n=1 Tax=Amycolatopsis sp. cmx-4-61 TaxID=2790937 RepID=UPI00397D5100